MQGAQNLRSEAYLKVRCNDEGEAQRRRWTFYETIILDFLQLSTTTRVCSRFAVLKRGDSRPLRP